MDKCVPSECYYNYTLFTFMVIKKDIKCVLQLKAI